MARSDAQKMKPPFQSEIPLPNPATLTAGVVKRLVLDKGFGFVREPGGTEYFFHQSAMRGTAFEDLREGDAVRFQPNPHPNPKGPRADLVMRDETPGNY
jgi:cold shock protein